MRTKSTILKTITKKYTLRTRSHTESESAGANDAKTQQQKRRNEKRKEREGRGVSFIRLWNTLYGKWRVRAVAVVVVVVVVILIACTIFCSIQKKYDDDKKTGI